MKRLITLIGLGILAFSIFSIAPAQGGEVTPSCVTPPSGIVAWWAGEGNANDLVGSNNGSLVGAVGYTNGEVGQAFVFDGADYVSIPDSPLLDTMVSSITIEAWIKVNRFDPDTSWDAIITKGNSSWRLARASNTSVIAFSTSGLNNLDLGGNKKIDDGQWHHVAGVYDGTNKYLYVDGVLDASTPATGAIAQNGYPAYIGENSEATGHFWNGLIDEVSVYNRALSSNEIAAIYNAGSAGKCTPPAPSCVTPPSGIVGWWKGESNILDSIGNDGGAVTAGTVTYAPAEAGLGFSFDGGANRILVPDAPQLNFGSNQDFSIEAWIEPQAAATFNGVMSIVDKRNAHSLTDDPNGYEFSLENGRIHCRFMSTGFGPYGPDLRDGNFHHVALSVSRNSTTGGNLYVDGQLVGTFDPTSYNGSLINTQPLRIGNHAESDLNCFFKGIIDEVSVYDRSLTALEIQSIYNAGSAGKCAPVSTCVPPSSGIVGWWPAEGNANDVVGGDNGALEGGATFAPGMVGQGFRLDGTNAYVQIPDSDALKPANVTVEAWVWLDPNVSPANEHIIFKQNSWSYLFEGYSLLKQLVDNGDGTYTARFSFVVSSGGNQVITYSTTAVRRGVWYHVAGTYDGTTATLWINGVAEASAYAGFALDYGTSPVFIGTTGVPGVYIDMLAGIIDEPSIYNRALSTNEIAAIYNAGSAGKCTGSLPPGISVQPVGQTVLEGSNAVLSVIVDGTGPFHYQWTFNETNLTGATNATLNLANLHPNQSGNYSVIISTTFGSITSSIVNVTVVAQDILVYKFSATEKITTAGQETSSGYSGEMFFIPASTNGTFVGWETVKGKKQFWVNTFSDYLLITIPGSARRTYTMLGKAGQEIDADGYPHIWSYLHKGLNTSLTIATQRQFSFPGTFSTSETHAYPDLQTGNMVLNESVSSYIFLPSNTQAANNNGQTMADLVNTLTSLLTRQGYKQQ